MRPLAEFDTAHLRGALALGTGAARTTRVGWAVDPDEQLVVVDRDVAGARRFACALHAVGLWAVAGVAAADPDGWHAAGDLVQEGPV